MTWGCRPRAYLGLVPGVVVAGEKVSQYRLEIRHGSTTGRPCMGARVGAHGAYSTLAIVRMRIRGSFFESLSLAHTNGLLLRLLETSAIKSDYSSDFYSDEL